MLTRAELDKTVAKTELYTSDRLVYGIEQRSFRSSRNREIIRVGVMKDSYNFVLFLKYIVGTVPVLKMCL